jgi:hypothetical protein
MRRGQTTLEIVILIGFVAVVIMAMRIYIIRGHQGRLRSQAEQLGAQQYAPGNTVIPDNIEIKTLTSTASAGSSTSIKHPAEHDVDEPNTELEALATLFETQAKELYALYWKYERALSSGPDGYVLANYARINGLPLPVPDSAYEKNILDQITAKAAALKATNDAMIASQANWPERNPNQTTSGSYSSESGTKGYHKHIDETLGNI